MIKEAIEKIIEEAKPVIQEIGGFQYSNKPLHLIDRDTRPETIQVNTLNGLIQYLTDNVDKLKKEELMIHIVDHKTVRVIDKYDDKTGHRKTTIKAVLNDCFTEFRFGQFIDQEKFCISLSSLFVENEALKNLITMAGNIKDETVSTSTDDGISQKAIVKGGVSLVNKITIPNPHILAPYRTFREVDQPQSPFIFRVNKDEDGIACALFEADGGKWRLDAMSNIEEYLKECLKDYSFIA